MQKILFGAVAAMAIAPALAQPTPPPAPVPPTAPAPQVRTFVHRIPMKAATRDEVVNHVREMFAKLDTNKDGFVTREEADAAHKAMAGELRQHFVKRVGGTERPDRDRGEAFNRLDVNKDGVITRDEFVSAQPQVRERRVIVMREGEAPIQVDGAAGHPSIKAVRVHALGMRMHGKMFERADANRDGRVSLQEMTDAALKHFDSADANRDGKLTPEERMQMRPQRKAQPMQPA
jgi:Ca2+-binding EF-hand superfamily protein